MSRNSLPWGRQLVHLGPLKGGAALRYPVQVGTFCTTVLLSVQQLHVTRQECVPSAGGSRERREGIH